MAMPKLYWVKFPGQPAYLSRHQDAAAESNRPAKVADLDSYDIADVLDQMAEAENRHALVGAHAKPASLIRRNADDEAADKVMLAVLKAGGLWELGG